MAMLGPTRDHGVILQWAVERGAVPVEVNVRVHDGDPAALAFVFLHGRGVPDEFRAISWESFFAQFDVLELALVYDDRRPMYELLQDGATPEALGYSPGPN